MAEQERRIPTEQGNTSKQGDTFKIMKLVTEITAARAGNETAPPTVETVDKLVRTLFSTMCELLEKEN